MEEKMRTAGGGKRAESGEQQGEAKKPKQRVVVDP
jgi:hypothetical protein